MTFSTFSSRFGLACLYMAKHYWMYCKEHARNVLLKIQTTSVFIGFNNPLFIEELVISDYDGSHIADERSGHTLMELQNRRLSVKGASSKDAVVESRYYIKFGDNRKILVSVLQFYKLIPIR